MESILVQFFKHQIIIKMLHFQTKYYGAHKVLDTYLDTFATLFDNFMESGQGIFGKLKVKSVKLNEVPCMTDTVIIKYLTSFVDYLSTFEALVGEQNTDLLNIRDEMKAETNKLIYLLSFE